MMYRREIDGLRALAVIPVVFFHAGISLFSGGFVGVDVFFVISGYLITTILISEMRKGDFSLLNFYERRAKRILPALFFITFMSIPFAWWFFSPIDLRIYSGSLLSVAAFASNIFFWRSSGYFDAASELQPLLHTWSLAVEEQYYLLFPLGLMLVWRLGKRGLWFVLALCAVVSFILSEWMLAHRPSAAFYLLPTRAWELLIGALAALYLIDGSKNSSPKYICELGAVVGLAMILSAIFFFDKTTPFPGRGALLPTVGAALIILCARQTTIVGRLLGQQFLVGVGLISYSLYLWHQPVLAFVSYRLLGELPLWLAGILLFLVFVLAFLTWKYIEVPLRKGRVERGRLFAISFLMITLVGAVGGFGYKNSELVDFRYTADQREILQYASYDVADAYRVGECLLSEDQSAADLADECLRDLNSPLIWGDSYAASLFSGFNAKGIAVSQLTAARCPPMLGVNYGRKSCSAINDAFWKKVSDLKPAVIVLAAAWFSYQGDEGMAALRSTLVELRRISKNSQVIIVGSFPHYAPDLPARLVRMQAGLGENLNVDVSEYNRFKSIDDELRLIASDHDVYFFSVFEAACVKQACPAVIGKEDGVTALWTWDYGHLTAAGSLLLVDKLTSAMAERAAVDRDGDR